MVVTVLMVALIVVALGLFLDWTLELVRRVGRL